MEDKLELALAEQAGLREAKERAETTRQGSVGEIDNK